MRAKAPLPAAIAVATSALLIVSHPHAALAQSSDDDGDTTSEPAVSTSGPPAPVFRPVLAGPREVATYATWLSWDAPWLETNIASTAIGRDFTVARWGDTAGTQVGISVAAAVLAQFDLNGPSFDFVNADFIVGVPVSVRRGPWSARGRFYHWSSHLGDEFLLRSGLTRRETAAEAIELVGGRRVGPVRLLAGGEVRTRRFPFSMGPRVARTGVEYLPEQALGRLGPLGALNGIAGVDVTWTRWSQADSWQPGVSVRAGFEVEPQDSETGRRAWAVQLEYYEGPSPFGQFFAESLKTVGVGVHLR